MLAETFELYDEVAILQRTQGFSWDQRLEELAEKAAGVVPPGFGQATAKAVAALIISERYMHELPPRSVDGMTLDEEAAYRNFLSKKRHYFDNQRIYHDLFDDVVVRILSSLGSRFPRLDETSPFTVPLLSVLPKPQAVVQGIFDALADQRLIDRGILDELAGQLSQNVARISGFELDNPKKVRWPADAEFAELPEYVRDTPFEELLQTPVPLTFTHNVRFSHMHVLGGTGAGKTTLLENLLLNDLRSPDRPSLVVIDSQGDLIRKLSRLDVRREDMILVSPKDVHHPPALNIFDVNRERLGSYDQATREQVIAGVIQTFDYLFSGLIGADLSAKQGVFFKFIARLMLALPETFGRNATILDMIALMEDPAPYREAIASLPPIQRNFFERDFGSKTFTQTKEQIRYRLHAILENPTLARLFTSPRTKLDLFTELNRGSVILVDTAKDFLKGASANFGQIFISLVLQAVLERAATRERHPTFIVIDEAAEYFDQNIDDLLTEVRKFNCGVVLAHQYLDQCTPGLRASLAANTSIKFAAGVSMSDARVLAPELRTSPDFIISQPRLHFAAHIRNVTPGAVSIPVEIGTLDSAPQLSADQYANFVEQNRERVAYREEPDVAVSTRPDEDVSDNW